MLSAQIGTVQFFVKLVKLNGIGTQLGKAGRAPGQKSAAVGAAGLSTEDELIPLAGKGGTESLYSCAVSE